MAMLTLIAQGILFFAPLIALQRLLAKTDLDNIPGPKAGSFFKDGRVTRLYGVFGSKHLHIYDPKALHHILVKDQTIYEETTAFFTFNTLVFGGGLLSTQGEQHKKQRKMLNPVFSIVHMRHMIPMFNDVAKKLEKAIKLQLANGQQEIDILQWMSRAALEMIGQSGLGYSFDPLVPDAKPHPFAEAAKAFVSVLTIVMLDSVTNSSSFDIHSPATSKLFFVNQYILPTLIKIGSPQFRRWVLDLLPFKLLHKVRDIIDIWDRTTVEIFEGKKKALREGDEALAKQIGQAKDLMSILMKANMEASEEDRLPDKEVLAQASFVNDTS
ncbi:hypothetical protein H0H92_005746 [Tricholoma furcatifolium]|nr:hypothetical protein H0H92_005746 [Tricholoma furcatifolium]